MLRSLSITLATAVALMVLPGIASAYERPATEAPVVKTADRSFFNVGRVCVRQLAGLAGAVATAATGGSAPSYLSSARTLKSRAAACIGKVDDRQAGTARGRKARAKLLRAMKLYVSAGAAYVRAAKLQRQRRPAGARAAARKAGVKLGKAKRLILRSDRLARGQR